jgi:hypothetical protein
MEINQSISDADVDGSAIRLNEKLPFHAVRLDGSLSEQRREKGKNVQSMQNSHIANEGEPRQFP